jgi:hypothetical protein
MAIVKSSNCFGYLKWIHPNFDEVEDQWEICRQDIVTKANKVIRLRNCSGPGRLAELSLNLYFAFFTLSKIIVWLRSVWAQQLINFNDPLPNAQPYCLVDKPAIV